MVREHAGQFTGPHALSTAHRSSGFRCCLTMRRKFGIDPSCMNRICCQWWRGTYSKSNGKPLKKIRWHRKSISTLGKTNGSRDWYPQMYCTLILVKVKFRPWRPRGDERYSSTLSLTSVLDRGGWAKPRPGRFTRGKENRYLLHRRRVGPQDRSGRVRKTTTLPRFDPRMVQPG
jgi:hypothetical protein